MSFRRPSVRGQLWRTGASRNRRLAPTTHTVAEDAGLSSQQRHTKQRHLDGNIRQGSSSSSSSPRPSQRQRHGRLRPAGSVTAASGGGNRGGDEEGESGGLDFKVVASLGVAGGFLALGAGAVVLKDEIRCAHSSLFLVSLLLLSSSLQSFFVLVYETAFLAK
jgi:hypothetical protein